MRKRESKEAGRQQTRRTLSAVASTRGCGRASGANRRLFDCNSRVHCARQIRRKSSSKNGLYGRSARVQVQNLLQPDALVLRQLAPQAAHSPGHQQTALWQMLHDLQQRET